MPFAKAYFSVFYSGDNHWFEPGDEVPDAALPHIGNKEGCLSDEETFELNYNLMTVTQLKQLVTQRGMEPENRKPGLIAQLEEDDAVRVE